MGRTMRTARHESAQLHQDIVGPIILRRRPALRTVLRVVKILDQGGAATGDAALHGSDGRIADLGGIQIGKATDGNQEQGFALNVRQLTQRTGRVGKLQ